MTSVFASSNNAEDSPFLFQSSTTSSAQRSKPRRFVRLNEGSSPTAPHRMLDIDDCFSADGIRCEILIREANRAVVRMRKETKQGKKVTEVEIYNMLEKICNPDSDEGEWIATIDMVESGTELKLVDMGTIGFCGSECRTIARACTDLTEELEYELAEALYKGSQERATLTQRFCRELSSVCNQKPPPLPSDRPEGPPFIPMSEEDYKMAKLMQQMKDMGLGGQVFDQDSARDFISQHSGYGSEDDDEDPYDIEKDLEGGSGGFSFMETMDWMKTEALKRSREGYEAVLSSGKNLYSRIAKRFKKHKTEL